MLNKRTFVCLDCETTGLEPKTDRLIEIAVCLFTFEEITESYETLIDPEILIPENTIEIHHITDEMVKGKPLVKEVLPKVLNLVQDHIIVGHGIQMDISFISEECKRAQIPCNIHENRFIDTLRLARLYGQSPVNSLERLRQHFNIADEGAHRAMSDVIVNIEVFKYLSQNFKTVKELQKRLEKPIQLKTMPLGKHKGRKFSEIPLEYLQWAVRKDFDMDLMYSIKSELKNRRKGNNFQQSSSPFADL
jgi:DNA polymerase-3 subunit epsilon